MNNGVTNLIGLNSQYYQNQKIIQNLIGSSGSTTNTATSTSSSNNINNNATSNTLTTNLSALQTTGSTGSTNSSTASSTSSGVTSSMISPSKLMQQQTQATPTLESNTPSVTADLLVHAQDYSCIDFNLLPASAKFELDQLELELLEGDITQKGYEKKKAKLLAPYLQSPLQHSSTVNSSNSFSTSYVVNSKTIDKGKPSLDLDSSKPESKLKKNQRRNKQQQQQTNSKQQDPNANRYHSGKNKYSITKNLLLNNPDRYYYMLF